MMLAIKLLMFGMTLASAETIRAETKVLREMSQPPPYTIDDGPLVSVVVIAYNEEMYLPMLLSALSNQTYRNTETIIVDNMSDDGTVQIAKSWGAKVAYNNEYNLSMSRNIGAHNARGDILVFFDADTVPQHDVIEKIVEAIDKGAAMVYTNKCCTDSHTIGMFRLASGWLSPRSQMNGNCIGCTREAFDAVDGFDETVLPQNGEGEDIEFCESIIKTFGPEKVTYYPYVYVGVSARRQKAETVTGIHWKSRSVR